MILACRMFMIFTRDGAGRHTSAASSSVSHEDTVFQVTGKGFGFNVKRQIALFAESRQIGSNVTSRHPRMSRSAITRI